MCCERWARDRGIQFSDRAELVRDIRVLDRYNRLVTELTRRFPLHTRPKRFTLLTRSFGVESGELTPTNKIRRSLLVQNFMTEIEELYS